jgi:hypothetical protein
MEGQKKSENGGIWFALIDVDACIYSGIVVSG